MSLRRALIFTVVSSLALVACGDDEDSGNNGTGGTGNEGTGGQTSSASTTISGIVSYEGDRLGPLLVSIHSDWPPSMTNVMGAAQIEDPEFPQDYEVEDVVPGTYFVAAYVAVGMFHVGAGPGDPQGVYAGDDMMPTPIEVSDDGATGIDLTLVDQ